MDDWFTTIARKGTDDNFVPPENWSNPIKTSSINAFAEWDTKRNQDRNQFFWPTVGPMSTQQQKNDDIKDDDSVLNDVIPAPEGVESTKPVNTLGAMPERQYPAQALQNNPGVHFGFEDNPYGCVSLKDAMVADHEANYLAALP
eukprot:15297285-Ditylum_brightwellii.AAC.1